MRRWQSGQMHLTVDQAGYALRGFESLPAHQRKMSRPVADSFSVSVPPRAGHLHVLREGFEKRSHMRVREHGELGSRVRAGLRMLGAIQPQLVTEPPAAQRILV